MGYVITYLMEKGWLTIYNRFVWLINISNMNNCRLDGSTLIDFDIILTRVANIGLYELTLHMMYKALASSYMMLKAGLS